MGETSLICVTVWAFIFNFFFGGIALISIGRVAFFNYVKEFLGDKYTIAPLILFICGIILLMFIMIPITYQQSNRTTGCCDRITECEELHQIMIFGVLLFVIAVATLAAGIIGFTYTKDLESVLKNNMNGSFVQHTPNSVEIWNYVQSSFHCCGVDGSDDYNKTQMTLPNSCCEKVLPSCEVYKEGCFDPVLYELKKYFYLFGGFGVGMAVIQPLIFLVFRRARLADEGGQYNTL